MLRRPPRSTRTDTLVPYSTLFRSFLSDVTTRYSADYFGDTRKFPPAMRSARKLKDGEEWDETIFNVFRKEGETVRHHWGSEMAFAPSDPGQNNSSEERRVGNECVSTVTSRMSPTN